MYFRSSKTSPVLDMIYINFYWNSDVVLFNIAIEYQLQRWAEYEASLISNPRSDVGLKS